MQAVEVILTAIEGALRVLNTSDALAKASSAREMRSAWLKTRQIGTVPDAVPDRPARPLRPLLVPPLQVPRRRLGSDEGRGALLHAVAHIELNAIDLAADMMARFAYDPLISETDREDFINDWSQVCDDEARHFQLLSERMTELGVIYGDHPAHDGLWSAAMNTAESFAARLAIAPLVLEARGLDVTPGMIIKLEQARDQRSADCLGVILKEEVDHVRIGLKWFAKVAESSGETAEAFFQHQVRTYFRGRLKPPFNEEARLLAGLKREFYSPLVELTAR